MVFQAGRECEAAGGVGLHDSTGMGRANGADYYKLIISFSFISQGVLTSWINSSHHYIPNSYDNVTVCTLFGTFVSKFTSV